MVLLSKEDVLKGLKKFKRLAKQDLLASEETSDPEFWSLQAEGRRAMYTWLMEQVETEGVDGAYDQALGRHADLPLLYQNKAEFSGAKQALEMFFTVLGKDEKQNPSAVNLTSSMEKSAELAE